VTSLAPQMLLAQPRAGALCAAYLSLLPLAACEEEEEVPSTLPGTGDVWLQCLSTDLAIHSTRTIQHCDRYFIS